MRLLVFVVLPFLLLGIGYMVGYATAGRREKPAKLTNPERTELHNLRELKHQVIQDASTHLVLDSPLATVILDTVREHDRKEIA